MKDDTITERCPALTDLPKYKQRHKWVTVAGSKTPTAKRGIWKETLKCKHCGCKFDSECTTV